MSKKVFFASFLASFLIFGSWSFSRFEFFNSPPASSVSPENSPADFSSQVPVNAVFVGDIMLSRSVAKQIANAKDYQFPFLKVKDFLNQADFVFGNLEGPISDRGFDQGSIYSFRAEPKTAAGLKAANFKVVSLANNHIFDWGREALLQTIEILGKNNIFGIGAGKDLNAANQILVFPVNGLRFGFFAGTSLYPESLEAGPNQPGVSRLEFEALAKEIQKIKTENLVDFMIVSLHWGEEYQLAPTALQIEQARLLADSGADLVLGHHPHVIQPYEKRGRGLIFYSLGNFVFDQSFSEETKTGLAVQVVFKHDRSFSAQLYRTRANEFFQPELGELFDSLTVL